MTPIPTSEIARRLGAQLDGAGDALIAAVAGVRDAGPGEIAFVSLARYAADAVSTKASALIVGLDWTAPAPCALIKVEKPERAFAEVARWFAPPDPAYPPGVHASAVVSPDAVLGEGVHIGPLAVIEAGAAIGARSIIGAQTYVGHGVRIGTDCRLFPQVSIREHCVLGDRVWIHNGAVIGSDGFGYDVDKQGVRTKQPQIGIVVIGDDVEIGANTTIDRARFGKTRIGRGVKIDNLVQIAHNVVIGDHAVLVSQVGIAGSTRVGAHAILAGQSGVAGHLDIGAGAIIGARTGVTRDVPPKAYMLGFPAAPQKEMARQFAALARLPELRERLLALQKRVEELAARGG
ncbi:MAG TPA: UDP-3-O-(3-hydroxymyristoyl)glucosamine N-acyltransferase [Kiritimatiellia bacterium]|nr:UDP-3-O-(3-hydroxymyristoyl)glucosamine N-acyltransferase [Kiritimatiellia bacterium]